MSRERTGAQQTSRRAEGPSQPSSEQDRLRALRRYRIFHTPREDCFDRIARLAAELADTPMAAISFIEEDRLWFKARIGLPFPATPRAHSFCDWTIRSVPPTVVPDAAKDERFQDYPLATGDAPIRFYAGAPLRTADGHALGALCVMDRQPRQDFDGRRQRMLQDLAALVMHEVESRELVVALQDEVESHLRTEASLRQEIGRRERAERALQQSGDQLRLALSLAGLGTWEARLADGRISWSPRQREIYGFVPDEDITGAKILSRLHPDDRERVEGMVRSCLSSDGPGEYATEFRIRWPDGADRWLVDKGLVVFEGERPVRIIGTTMDITELKAAEIELRRSLQQKNTLLRELHHRVKNNLQAIWGMVQLEAIRTKDVPQARERMEVIAERLSVLGQLHQQIYNSEDVSRIALAPYLESLARNLLKLHASSRDIVLDLAMEPFFCDLEAAIPLALIANELITNSLNHAFPGRSRGTIRISMAPLGDGRVEIAVADDGLGFPDAPHREGIGLLMVKSLAGQIDAEWRQDTRPGSRMGILIPAGRLFRADETDGGLPLRTGTRGTA